ncbi:MAG TPA: ABC transporter permease [Candidatus Saccharimonadales bacterium]|nr:ABC transporter permease [Candidatus Saccharimonadales bacterium]
MRFLLLHHAQNAYQSLRSSRVRSALTMLGVTIGIAAITAILSLSGGASKVVGDQIESLGGNIAVIRPGLAADPIANLTQAQPHRDFAASTLTEDDIRYIKNIRGIESVAPMMVLSGTIKADSSAPNGSMVLATTPNLATISDIQVRDGQFLDEKINQNTVVIGPQLSINIFGTDTSLGKTLTIRGQPFTVIGILKRTNNPINYNSIDFDNAAIINFESGKKLNQGVAQIQQVNIRADSIEQLDQAIIDINKTLLMSHDDEHDFLVLTGNQIAQPTSQLFFAIAGVTTAIAAISLLVGGIGIMNIMLVTVAERTREIGIRKALGASNSDIYWQFLIESLAISIGGGIAGYISGYIVAFGVSTFLTFNPIIHWNIALAALVISLIMGTLFGLYPAIRAASKDPIESLRQYN